MSGIEIKLENKIIYCNFDKYGNIYFSVDNEIYDLYITNKNTLVLDKYNIDNNNDTDADNIITIGEIIPFYNNATLRGKIIKETNNDSDDDEYKKNYFQEDLEFNEYINEKENYDQPYFTFNITSDLNINNNLIVDRETIHALYDCIIYSGNFETGNIMMKTTLVNDMPIYRLCVYTSGDIKFRPIGSSETIYKLQYDNKLILVIK